MKKYIDVLSTKNIFNKGGYSKTYNISNINIDNGNIVSESYIDSDTTSIKIHTPFVIEWDENDNSLTLIGVIYNENNSFDENLRCAAAYAIIGEYPNYWNHKNWLSMHIRHWHQFDNFSTEEICNKIINLAENPKFKKEVMETIEFAKLKAKIPNTDDSVLI